ncbi:heavy-metal-associated domain-containing protein [Bacillus sp. RAR_GA_16]|uniref:heavy-metal-associated domain-containing protein n=1 Tax=Bacillus sp. RAR_GA_16 TaxID=2876774 RepID=UPI001CCFC75D|nr:heavy-metal-associated domain-containing protein [Bacillus sp. RAR_GA_16]MCA0171164.1 cation transporter [Bacillus sp. RAR_GA_16]
MEQVTLKIDGMTGDYCAAVIRSALLESDGVSAVEIHCKEGNAEVTFDPSKVSRSALQEIVENQGYVVS